MRPVRAAAAGVRHMGAAGLEAVLLASILTMGLLAISPFYQPAATWTHTGETFAAAKLSGHIYVSDSAFGSQMTATLNPGGPAAWGFAQCSQNGVVVYQQYVKGDANNQVTFTLGPTPLWPSGAASCIAQEGTWSNAGKWKVLAQSTFNVY